jgi:hypothetical protein
MQPGRGARGWRVLEQYARKALSLESLFAGRKVATTEALFPAEVQLQNFI